MNILVFNCGSSSLKYRLIEMPSEKELAGGEAQRVGPKTTEPARIIHRLQGREENIFVDMVDHVTAFKEVMKILSKDSALTPHAFGHRLVHGGARFETHAVITPDRMVDLKAVEGLAPLHNPPAVKLIEACGRLYPRLPQVAIFDTAFHASIPAHARTYAIPRDLSSELGIRKFGFHGTSHQYVVEEAAKLLGKPLDKLNAVSCHLGSGGASICAVVNGKSVDNTMGYSPLQGLVMSTRCGDLDPAVTLKMLTLAEGKTALVERNLNKNSGVLGLSRLSPDIRDILTNLARAGQKGETGFSRVNLTSQIYLWRIRKYIGAYLAVVGKPDAIIFTDTIGETVPFVRGVVCGDMECFGIKIDPQKNLEQKTWPVDIAADDSPVRVLVIQTNEEIAIARQTFSMLNEQKPSLQGAVA